MNKNKKYFIIEDNSDIFIIPKRIMIFAGHPDDEIISCGGTIIKYQELGSDITLVLGTKGIGGYSQESQKDTIFELRENEIREVVKELKCNLIDLGYNNLSIDRKKIARITNLIREYRPQVILMPHYMDFHRIHRDFSFIIRESIYHSVSGKAYGGTNKQWTPLAVYYYESPSCKFQYIKTTIYIIVDIEKHWERKKKIFNQFYNSQKKVLDQIFFWAESTARIRGNEINVKYGEAFIPDTTYTPLKIILE